MEDIRPARTNPAFVTTRWSMIDRAGGTIGSGQSDALAELCRVYWYPVYAYVRRTGASPHDAQDLTQTFFAWLLEHRVFAKATRSRGRFRSFLLGVARRFLDHERQKANALKRGGKSTLLSLDECLAESRFRNEPFVGADAESLFDAAWARTTLQQVRAKLRSAYESSGEQDRYVHLEPYLPGSEGEPPPTAEVARALAVSEGTLRVQVHRLREQFRKTLRSEIAKTVSSPKEVDDEIRHLILALSR